MGRLVDVEEVIRAVDRHTKNESEVVLDEDITIILEEIPTAYDVEKIVAKLEEQAEENQKYWNEFDDEDSYGAMNAYLHSIKIVKGLDS